MVSLDVLKKIRNDLVDKKILIVSDDMDKDRVNLIEALSDYIVKEEALCKKSKLTSD